MHTWERVRNVYNFAQHAIPTFYIYTSTTHSICRDVFRSFVYSVEMKIMLFSFGENWCFLYERDVRGGRGGCWIRKSFAFASVMSFCAHVICNLINIRLKPKRMCGLAPIEIHIYFRFYFVYVLLHSEFRMLKNRTKFLARMDFQCHHRREHSEFVDCFTDAWSHTRQFLIACCRRWLHYIAFASGKHVFMVHFLILRFLTTISQLPILFDSTHFSLGQNGTHIKGILLYCDVQMSWTHCLFVFFLFCI